MASAGEMTPPTGGRNPSWARAAGASKMPMTEIVMTKSALMRADRDMSTPKNYTTLAFPEERGESVQATRTYAAVRESAGEKPSTIVLAMRPASEAWGKRHENGTKHLLSSDRQAKPAVESGLSSRRSPQSQERNK